MRTIKFRGKRVDNFEWIEGDLIHIYNFDNSQLNEWCLSIKPKGHVMVDVIPETVGQFTGKTDINGIDVYELDTITDGANVMSVKYIDFAFYAIWSKFKVLLSELTNVEVI